MSVTFLAACDVRRRDSLNHPAPEPMLLRLFDDDDLAIALVRCMTPRTAARCGLTCRMAANRLHQQRELARLCHEYRIGVIPHDAARDADLRLARQGLECCRPGEQGHPDLGKTDMQMASRHLQVTRDGERDAVWTFHRLFLWQYTPVFRVVPFAPWSDQLTPEAHGQIGNVAEWLNKHPGLQVMITGHAAPVGDALHDLGVALAQARAAHVRQRLLGYLIVADGHRYWRDWEEDTDTPVRLRELISEGVLTAAGAGRQDQPYGGFLGVQEDGASPRLNVDGDADLGDELRRLLACYEQRVIGNRVRAEGRFPFVDSGWSTPTRMLQLEQAEAAAEDEEEAQDMSIYDAVEISVVGFKPHSPLAF